MANKKISQLVGLGPYAGVSGEFYLPASAGSSTVPYATRRITTSELAEYVFSGDSVTGGFPATQLSGTKDVYLNKASWDTASTDVTTNPYIQVRLTDGKLITGSGMSVPSSAGDNMGNCTATTTLLGSPLTRTLVEHLQDHACLIGSPQGSVFQALCNDIPPTATF